MTKVLLIGILVVILLIVIVCCRAEVAALAGVAAAAIIIGGSKSGFRGGDDELAGDDESADDQIGIQGEVVDSWVPHFSNFPNSKLGAYANDKTPTGFFAKLFGRLGPGTVRWTNINRRSLGNFDFVAKYWYGTLAGERPVWLNNPMTYKLSRIEETAIIYDFDIAGVHNLYDNDRPPAQRWETLNDDLATVKEKIKRQWSAIGNALIAGDADNAAESILVAVNYDSRLAQICDERRRLKDEIDKFRRSLVVDHHLGGSLAIDNITRLVARRRELKLELKADRRKIKAAFSPAMRGDMSPAVEQLFAGLDADLAERKNIKSQLADIRRRIISPAAEILIGEFADWIKKYIELAWTDMLQYEVTRQRATEIVAGSDSNPLPAKPSATTIAWWRRKELDEIYSQAERRLAELGVKTTSVSVEVNPAFL